jgi:hypothetical protein
LAILEYSNEDIVLAREQFFINKLMPVYNLIKVVDLSTGTKRGEISPEMRLNISLARRAYYAKHTSHLAKPIKIIDLSTNSEKIYKSIDQAAIELKIAKKTIRKYIDNQKVYKNLKLSWFNTPLG